MKQPEQLRLPVGLTVYKGDWEGAQWTVTGYPDEEFTGRQWEGGAYEFEDVIKKHVNINGIEFDCESSQFFAYAKTKQRAVAFGRAINKYFEKAKHEVALTKAKVW